MRFRTPYVLVASTCVVLALLLLAVTSKSGGAKAEAHYVGVQTCVEAGCHAEADEGENYHGVDKFMETMHARIHERPHPGNVLIEEWFEKDSVLTIIESSEDSIFIMLGKGESETDYRAQIKVTGPFADSTGWMKIAYNYGGNGWLQRFLVEVDGNYYPLPFQYILPTYRAYKDTGQLALYSRLYFLDKARWYVIDTVDGAGEVGPRLFDFKKEEFISQSWDKRCAACHVNGFDLELETTAEGAKKYTAKWVGSDGSDSAIRDMNIMVGCESCHGPGSNHVSDPENEEFKAEIDPARWDPTGNSFYWTDRKLDLCNQCHNRHASTDKIHTYQYDDANMKPYLPRLELKNFVNDTVLGGQYWADKKTSYAHHQTGQDYWRSSHYTEHVFKNGCFDCHDPHTTTDQPYQLNRDWYSLKRGEGCVAFGCHDTFAKTEMQEKGLVNVHTQHLNSVSQCVNCHYTKTATIAFANGTLEFSDHSDKVIRPTATKQHANSIPNGMLNTCAASCHRNGYGDRNSPYAFDNGVSVDSSIWAPDYGIHDLQITNYRERTDMWLADSLWEGYKRLYPQFVTAVRIDNAVTGAAGITALSPNPASQQVTIRFNLPKREKIRIEIYDASGKSVRVVADGSHAAGTYEEIWLCEDEMGRWVESGTYFIRLIGESFTSSRKVVVVR